MESSFKLAVMQIKPLPLWPCGCGLSHIHILSSIYNSIIVSTRKPDRIPDLDRKANGTAYFPNPIKTHEDYSLSKLSFFKLLLKL